MASQELGSRMYYNIRPEIKRILEIRRQEGVINNQEHTPLFALSCKFRNVRHVHHRIGRSLKIYSSGIFFKKRCIVFFTQVCGGKFDSVLLVYLIKEPHAPAVQIRINDNMVSRSEDFHKRCYRRHSAGKSHCIRTMFKLCHHILKLFPCRVLHSGVVKPGAFSQPPVCKGCCLVYGKTKCSPLIRNTLFTALTDCLYTLVAHDFLLCTASYN